jgi:hypothetical protein
MIKIGAPTLQSPAARCQTEVLCPVLTLPKIIARLSSSHQTK